MIDQNEPRAAEFGAPEEFQPAQLAVPDDKPRVARFFNGRRLWPYSGEAEHIISSLIGEVDTVGLASFIAVRTLADIDQEYNAWIDRKIDRDTALDRTFGSFLEIAERSDRRNVFRAQCLRAFAALSPALRLEARGIWDALQQEAADSAMISTAIDGGEPKN